MVAGVPIVKFSRVCKRFGDGPPVLDGVDLDCQRGDFISLIGPSGCGKSTLLRLVAALSPVTSGELEVFGGEAGQAHAQLGFIFQEATLLPWLTARENVELPLRLRGVPATERARRALELLRLVRLGAAADYYPRQLSGGMRMRVSIARALVFAPQLLLLDEPFGALDEMTRNHLNEELLDWRSESPFTAFFVTHSVTEAVFLSNRIIVMGAAPGHIHAEVHVDLPYPRHPEVRDLPAYHEKVAAVSALLHAVEVKP